MRIERIFEGKLEPDCSEGEVALRGGGYGSFTIASRRPGPSRRPSYRLQTLAALFSVLRDSITCCTPPGFGGEDPLGSELPSGARRGRSWKKWRREGWEGAGQQVFTFWKVLLSALEESLGPAPRWCHGVAGFHRGYEAHGGGRPRPREGRRP